MNIFIFGANWYNHGDESAVRAMIDELKIKYPNCNIKIQFNQIVEALPYKNIEIIPGLVKPRRRDIIKYFLYNFSITYNLSISFVGKYYREWYRQVISVIRWSDICVYAPGGPSIGDIYKQYQLVYMMMLMKKNKKKYFLFAPSVGPFLHKKKNIKRGLDNAYCICFREPISQAYYRELSPGKASTVTLDSAFQHTINENENERKLEENVELKNYINKFEKIVAITVIDFIDYGNNPTMERLVKESFLNLLKRLKTYGYGVVFIPQLFGKASDQEYMESFAINGEFVISSDYDCYFQQYLISKCYATIGMRYHSNIFSAKMGTPFISVAYEHKMIGFMNMNGLGEYCIQLNELNDKSLIEKFAYLENDYFTIKNLLMKKRSEFKERSYRTSELLYNAIEEISE